MMKIYGINYSNLRNPALMIKMSSAYLNNAEMKILLFVKEYDGNYFLICMDDETYEDIKIKINDINDFESILIALFDLLDIASGRFGVSKIDSMEDIEEIILDPNFKVWTENLLIS